MAGGGEGGGVGLALIRGWALINFFCLKNGCLFRLRVVPHFSSGIVERAKREHT